MMNVRSTLILASDYQDIYVKQSLAVVKSVIPTPQDHMF
jgi:hypothetical protein